MFWSLCQTKENTLTPLVIFDDHANKKNILILFSLLGNYVKQACFYKFMGVSRKRQTRTNVAISFSLHEKHVAHLQTDEAKRMQKLTVVFVGC